MAQDSPLSWHGRAVGLMDLDAFFASVEQLDHPQWRGKPVIVGGSPKRHGVVSTASYEARAFGVHSAMPSMVAQRLCPHAIWTRGDHRRYRELSNAVMDIIVNETPLVEQVSIDEAFFDVTPGTYSNESPITICRRIQERVSELGITCSIGLGTNKTVAKIASEREKPRGLTVVLPGTEASFLAPLPVRALSGIGSASERTLLELHIRTLGELARQDPSQMEAIFGVAGPHMVQRAQGREDSRVRAIDEEREVKSVSHERTFAVDLTSAQDVRAAIGHVSELVGMRLRRKGLEGSQVTLKIKLATMRLHTAQRQLEQSTHDERVFGPVACELLDELWVPGTPIRLVGVAMSGFGRRPTQLSLFEDTQEQGEKTDALLEATDKLRQRFGSDALMYGRDLRLKNRMTRE
ncbi:MAG: DNA polymerase IV [Coriobacteriales bacterium]|nr:DNA polymerase IV [Coriobacteriales bacterium]